MLKISVHQEKGELLELTLKEAFRECGIEAELLLNSNEHCDICVITDSSTQQNADAKILITPNSKTINTSAHEIITYGLCCKNTLTVSSCISTNMVCSIQRAISTLNGSIIEVQDFPIKLSDTDEPELILAVCSVLLCSGVPISQISALPF